MKTNHDALVNVIKLVVEVNRKLSLIKSFQYHLYLGLTRRHRIKQETSVDQSRNRNPCVYYKIIMQ